MSGRLVLVRHGQSYGNVDKRLDTRPPGAELTPLGREQARTFARSRERPPGLLAHSVATRAAQTAGEIGAELGVATHELDGIHEVQVGDLENRNDEAAVEEFDKVYRRWHEGDLDVALPGGESGADVLERYVPVLTDLRMRHLDDHEWTADIVVVSHGAAIRLVGAVLGGVDGGFALELPALGSVGAAVLSRTARCTRRRGEGVRRPDGLSALASRHVAVDDERMHDQFGAGAALIGAFRMSQRVHDERAVAVFQPRLAFAAPHTHGPFLSLPGDNLGTPRQEMVSPSRVGATGRRRYRNGGRSRG
jgi:probable phosphoglycerate mutase